MSGRFTATQAQKEAFIRIQLNLYRLRDSLSTFTAAIDAAAEEIGEVQNAMSPATVCPGEVTDPDLHPAFQYQVDGHGGEAVSLQRNSVYAVENLNASGQGSLAEAPSDSYIVFPNLSGAIALQTAAVIVKPQWTVFGQTSPNGIELRGGQAADHEGLADIKADDHIWHHIRFRPDAPATAGNCCHGPFIFFRHTAGALVNCSLMYGDDDCLDVFEHSDVSVISCLIGNGLDTTAKRARGAIASRSQRVSFLRNLFLNGNLRGPYAQDCDLCDIYNNLTINMTRGIAVSSHTGTPTSYNVESNVAIRGGLTSGFWRDIGGRNPGGQLRIFQQNNIVMNNYNDDCELAPEPYWFDDDHQGAVPPPTAANPTWFVSQRFDCRRLLDLDVCEVRDHVTLNAGATHRRDAVDAALIAGAINGTGGSQGPNPGPWANIQQGANSAVWDLSKPDKVSDAAKVACGLDPATHQDTTQTNTSGSSPNDFVYLMQHYFGNLELN